MTTPYVKDCIGRAELRVKQVEFWASLALKINPKHRGPMEARQPMENQGPTPRATNLALTFSVVGVGSDTGVRMACARGRPRSSGSYLLNFALFVTFTITQYCELLWQRQRVFTAWVMRRFSLRRWMRSTCFPFNSLWLQASGVVLTSMAFAVDHAFSLLISTLCSLLVKSKY